MEGTPRADHQEQSEGTFRDHDRGLCGDLFDRASRRDRSSDVASDAGPTCQARRGPRDDRDGAGI